MKLLVTGGAGFIGSNFIHYWLGKHANDEIVNIDKMTYAADPENLNGIEKYRYEFVNGDITDNKIVGRLVKDTDVIVNFAAESHVDNSISGSDQFVRSNIFGTHTMLEAARKHEKRIHQVSTDEVYGPLPLKSKKRFTENSRYLPMNPYAATKAAADHLVRSYCNTYGLKATISNCGNNFGPRQHAEKLVPKTITNALAGRKIPVYGDGKQVRDWIYVSDHCSAIESILRKGRYGETYLVGAGHEKRNIDLIRLILKELGKPETLISHTGDRPGHDVRYALNASKMRKELGWKPRFSFEEGLKKTIEWYRKRS